jgi:prepilin-type N-terminal cleavage/methylation domain-containing protein
VKIRAFTIIELLVVLLIVALIISIGSITLSEGRKSSRDARRMSDVVSLSQAIEQSVSVNGGVYPRNVGVGQGQADAQARMCAGELFASGNPNNLNLSLFTSNTVPTDPLPLQPGTTTGCRSFLQGYTYHTPRGTCALGANSLAACQSVVYTIEVGFENARRSEDTLFRAPAELGISPNYTLETSPVRTDYLLNGRFCGTSCYNR